MSLGSNKQLEGGEGKQLFGQTSTGSQGQETATHHPAQFTLAKLCTYLSKLSNVFVQLPNYICPKVKSFLSKCQIICDVSKFSSI